MSRSATRILRLVLPVLVALVAGATAARTPSPASVQTTADRAPLVDRVDSVSIVVADLDRALDFYTRVLPFELESQSERTGDTLEQATGVFGARLRSARLRLGTEHVELHQYLVPEGLPIPQDSRSNDRWFQHVAIVVADLDRAYAHLRAHRVRHASTGPQTLPLSNPNAGGISAFYFKDPDGHVLELIHFPKGKGDPRWQNHAPDALFLGIDHTAIVVQDTDHALAFYRDVLGLRVAGHSENSGTEQEHLNNVRGARLRITALRAHDGPGIEFLEYLAPTDGRPYPAGANPNDLLAWTTNLHAADRAALERALRDARVAWISPGFVTVDGLHLARVRDLDGHILAFDHIPAAMP